MQTVASQRPIYNTTGRRRSGLHSVHPPAARPRSCTNRSSSSSRGAAVKMSSTQDQQPSYTYAEGEWAGSTRLGAGLSVQLVPQLPRLPPTPHAHYAPTAPTVQLQQV